MRRPLVAGNWKMHGTRASVAALLDGLREQALPDCVSVAIMPTFLHLDAALTALAGSGIQVGAQDCAIEAQPMALTGEIAASQLADAGCSHVLVGHSERRLLLGESDAVVARKFMAAQSCGLIPLLCVGETLEERESGRTLDVVAAQVAAVIAVAGIQALGSAVIAYEPVWAIGTGKTASDQQAQEVHAFIRSLLVNKCGQNVADAMRILYGGSVKPDNAKGLLGQSDIDGALVGGASLKAESFAAIVNAAG